MQICLLTDLFVTPKSVTNQCLCGHSWTEWQKFESPDESIPSWNKARLCLLVSAHTVLFTIWGHVFCIYVLFDGDFAVENGSKFSAEVLVYLTTRRL